MGRKPNVPAVPAGRYVVCQLAVEQEQIAPFTLNSTYDLVSADQLDVFGNTIGTDNHAFPKIRIATCSIELDFFEPTLGHERRKSFVAEKLDVSPIEEGIDVLVPSVDERDSQVLQVSVIRGRTDESSAWSCGRKTASHETSWVI